MGDTLGIVVYKKVTQEMKLGGNEQLVKAHGKILLR